MIGPVRAIAFTGATSGPGRAAADQPAKDGHKLIPADRGPKRAEPLARQLPAAAVTGAGVPTVAGTGRAATQIEDAAGHLNALVNNAGVMIPARQTASEGTEPNFAVHHLAPYSMISRLLPCSPRRRTQQPETCPRERQVAGVYGDAGAQHRPGVTGTSIAYQRHLPRWPPRNCVRTIS